MQGHIHSTQELSSLSRGSDQSSQDIYTVKKVTDEPHKDTWHITQFTGELSFLSLLYPLRTSLWSYSE